MDIYLIPGLASDHRLFERLELPGHTLHCLEWHRMPERSTIERFARALATKVDVSRPHALVGVSMGGMVAQEMAALTKPSKVVIISSWKGRAEMPWNIRASQEIGQAMLNTFPARDLRVMIDAIVHWDGPPAPIPGLVHIHGDKDRLMPISLIRGARVIHGGTHFMVYAKGKEVSAAVMDALREG
ncbi:MAG: alpha/beta fold hydrolase [Flavobacteriales bacterium]|nr:alpha/beta fold hydrolase [Flavobacteriales bacterium]